MAPAASLCSFDKALSRVSGKRTVSRGRTFARLAGQAGWVDPAPSGSCLPLSPPTNPVSLP